MSLLQQNSRTGIKNCRPLFLPSGHKLQRSVVVAMITVWVMQTSLHEVIHMVSMRHRLVSAIGSVHVLWGMPAGPVSAAIRMGLIDFDHVFIDMVAVHVMKMAIMQVICVAIVFHCNMPAARSVLVRMIDMFIAGTHSELRKSHLCSLGNVDSLSIGQAMAKGMF